MKLTNHRKYSWICVAIGGSYWTAVVGCLRCGALSKPGVTIWEFLVRALPAFVERHCGCREPQMIRQCRDAKE